MSKYFFRFFSFLKYLRLAGNRHSVHSPFVYSLADTVLRNHTDTAEIRKIESLRHKFLKKSQVIEITDFGSASGKQLYEHRFESVSGLVKRNSVTHKYGRLLFHLVQHFKPLTIVELGTSMGISTLYLALAHPEAKVYTVDGCTTTSEQASVGFAASEVENIEQHIGRFDIVLPELTEQIGNLDFAFIDGNHTYEATLANFEALMKISHNDTVFVFDDIHWSSEMEQAWNKLIMNELVSVSIDVYQFGILFLKKELSKQHFVLRY
jgi:predicted O-methyltransferase YrrM